MPSPPTQPDIPVPDPAPPPFSDPVDPQQRPLKAEGNSDDLRAGAYIDRAAEAFETGPHFRPSHGWSTYMAGMKSVGDLTEDFGADLAALRDDIAKLTSSVAAFVNSQSTTTQNKVFEAVGNTQKKMSQLSDTASKAQDRVVSTSADLGAAVERNPFISVFVAMTAGFIVGMVSQAGK
jgi:ElaB/YqjD/DUF883 family membrane-anchored ribosome-binding protein